MSVIKIREEKKEDIYDIQRLVRDSFKYGTKYSDGEPESKLVDEIRSKKYYLPELTFIAEDNGEKVGFIMMSNYPLNDGKDYLLISPVAVECTHFGKGIGTQMMKLAVNKAKDMGYKGIILEGNPDYYHRFGFDTSTKFGISAGENLNLPMEECLMALELVKGGFKGVDCKIDFADYYDNI